MLHFKEYPMSKAPRTRNTSMAHLEPAEVLAVLRAAKARGAREWSMIVLAYKHGLRASEVCNARLGDGDLTDRQRRLERRESLQCPPGRRGPKERQLHRGSAQRLAAYDTGRDGTSRRALAQRTESPPGVAAAPSRRRLRFPVPLPEGRQIGPQPVLSAVPVDSCYCGIATRKATPARPEAFDCEPFGFR